MVLCGASSVSGAGCCSVIVPLGKGESLSSLISTCIFSAEAHKLTSAIFLWRKSGTKVKFEGGKPLDTTKLTAWPLSKVSPAAGSWEITAPFSTVKE